MLLSVLLGGLALFGLVTGYLTLLPGLLFGAGFFVQGWRQMRG